jgi:phospholipase C
VYNQEYRHTSLIATLRKTWGLGQPFTQRDASARTFDHVFSLATPRDPETWAAPSAHPEPAWTMDPEVVGQALSTLGKGIAPALITRARQMGVQLPAELNDPQADLPPRLIVTVLRQIAGHLFPLLAADAKDAG